VTIFERALEMVPDESVIGLGSGRAAWAFVELLGRCVRAGRLKVRGVPTSAKTADVAARAGVPLVGLEEADELAITVDGADEVDPALNLVKGYGRALVREKVVAAASRRLVILVGEAKLVRHLGDRGRLPVEVVPFAVPLCRRRLACLGLKPELWCEGSTPGLTDNGNHVLDCAVGPLDNPARLDDAIRRVPGVVGTGLFVDMTDTVLVGDDREFHLSAELRCGAADRRPTGGVS
jgi:ribose 5-phosphate isomerase A